MTLEINCNWLYSKNRIIHCSQICIEQNLGLFDFSAQWCCELTAVSLGVGVDEGAGAREVSDKIMYASMYYVTNYK